jgi:hypothetical protein
MLRISVSLLNFFSYAYLYLMLYWIKFREWVKGNSSLFVNVLGLLLYGSQILSREMAVNCQFISLLNLQI